MKRFDKSFRLTPFEEYMFRDESPAFPMYSWQRFRFCGHLDFEPLSEAFRDASARHPLMNARIVTNSRGVPYWEFLETSPEIKVVDAGTTAADELCPDIRETSGLAMFYRSREENGEPVTDLDMLTHHSVADALGIQLFTVDFLLGYAQRKGADVSPDSYAVISPRSMEERLNPGITWGRYLRLLSYGTKTTRDLVFRSPEPLLPLKRADRDTPPEHDALYREFLLTPEESKAYVHAAKSRGGSLNDLLLRDFFLGTADFKRRFVPKSNKWIRIAMPINMRTPKCPPLFAANVVSMVFLDRRPSQISESESFARGIREETVWIKRTDQGLSLLENLKGRRNLPGGIKMELKGNKCWSTTILSNLGVIFGKAPFPKTEDGRLIVGGAVLDSFLGVPPVRAKTFTGWGCWTYAGRLGLSMRYDERYLNPEQYEYAFEACKKRVYDTVQAELNREK